MNIIFLRKCLDFWSNGLKIMSITQRIKWKILNKSFRLKIIIYTLLIILLCATIHKFYRLNYTVKKTTRMGSLRTLSTPYPNNPFPSNNDYHQLIDLKDFKFTIMNLPCNDVFTPPLLIVLVQSNPTHLVHRNTIRQTWGSISSPQMRLFFMLGQVGNNTKLQQQLYRENDVFRDLIQGSFFDAYRNMTYKHVMVFKYVIYHCPQAKYILKTDDDVFVHTPLLMNFITVDLSHYGRSRMLFCSLQVDTPVMRNPTDKWYVSVSEYPSATYPPYCPGWAIFYSQDVVFDLYREAQQAQYFWIDDVHVTGTLAKKINLSHVNINNVVLSPSVVGNKTYLQKSFNQTFLFSSPDIKPKEIEELWKFVQSRETPQSIFKYVDLD